MPLYCNFIRLLKHLAVLEIQCYGERTIPGFVCVVFLFPFLLPRADL